MQVHLFMEDSKKSERKYDEKTSILELWHGPTSAFKDMALQIMPRLFTRAFMIEVLPDPLGPAMTISNGRCSVLPIDSISLAIQPLIFDGFSLTLQ